MADFNPEDSGILEEMGLDTTKGIVNAVKKQLRSVIEWNNSDPEILFEKWTEDGDEIKNASKLIVGPGQGCIFVYEGKVEATLIEDGKTDLVTDNIPFWTTVTKFMQAFESEHKVGIYFFKTADILNRRWGTPSKIKYIDPVYKFPVGLGAFGNYSIKITKPEEFFVNVVGSMPRYAVGDIQNVISSRINQPMADYLATSGFSYVEIDSNREEIAHEVKAKIQSVFDDLGFALLDFRIEGTNFDDETNKHIQTIAEAGAEMQAAKAAGVDFAELQRLKALRDAAKNEGGAAGAGVGIGAGIGLGQQMAAGMNNASAQSDPAADLKKLKGMLDDGLIEQGEYDKKKEEILARM